MAKDLQPLEFGELSWNDPEAVATSLRTIHAQVDNRARRTIAWYLHRRRACKLWSWVLRLVALAFILAGGIVPFVDELLPSYPSDLGYLFIALGGAVLLANNALGLSAGWIRYMQTALHLQAVLNTFQFEWEQVQLDMAGNPGPDQNRQALQALKAFSQSLDAAIQAETDRWSADMADTLRLLEGLSLKQRGRDEEPPAPPPG
jgi:hypothetical protein